MTLIEYQTQKTIIGGYETFLIRYSLVLISSLDRSGQSLVAKFSLKTNSRRFLQKYFVLEKYTRSGCIDGIVTYLHTLFATVF